MELIGIAALYLLGFLQMRSGRVKSFYTCVHGLQGCVACLHVLRLVNNAHHPKTPYQSSTRERRLSVMDPEELIVYIRVLHEGSTCTIGFQMLDMHGLQGMYWLRGEKWVFIPKVTRSPTRSVHTTA